MSERTRTWRAGVGTAILAAALFGLSTPLSKLLVGQVAPVLLAGLLYLGSGTGLAVVFLVLRRGTPRDAAVRGRDLPWLGGAILFGGVLGPILLMAGLKATAASAAALLLNLEGLFTALLAWFVFHENFDQRIALGMALIFGGCVLLSWEGRTGFALSIRSLQVAAACLCWAIDNNLTQKVSGGDPVFVAAAKGLVAGTVNLAVALWLGATLPSAGIVGSAMLVGFVGYGVSLVLFVLALRHIGTARTGAYFSLAPFIGAGVSVSLLREPVGPVFWIAAGLMAAGVWLHLSERHQHEHDHESISHNHRHVHDEHHQHAHEPGVLSTEPHTHMHVHEPIRHSHLHYPDIHHRHGH
jgi:drug/metabolite transporter (DMT)-like permease